jgi:hypothetical protein
MLGVVGTNRWTAVAMAVSRRLPALRLTGVWTAATL